MEDLSQCELEEGMLTGSLRMLKSRVLQLDVLLFSKTSDVAKEDSGYT